MKRIFRVGAIAVGAMAAALAAGAFAFIPAPRAVTAVAASGVPASIWPSTPLKAVGGSPGVATFATNSVTSIKSLNWVGYAASFGTTTFRYVSAHFNVPYLDCAGVTAPNSAWSVHWVGLDGFRTTSTTLEQTGLLARCNGTTPAYTPFWETFPNGPGFPGITVHPGDGISLARALGSAPATFQRWSHLRLLAVYRCCHIRHGVYHYYPSHRGHGIPVGWVGSVVIVVVILVVSAVIWWWRRNQAA